MAPLLEAGHRVFGENRVQEAMAKWPPLREKYPDIELHLIGPLQSNKTREAVELFDVIESVDREKIAKALSEEIARTGKRPRLFVQVNTGAEPQKAGVLPESADSFLAACRDAYGLKIEGLMCVPPVGEQASPHFALLADIAARNGINELSMGMSSDFELAIQLGRDLCPGRLGDHGRSACRPPPTLPRAHRTRKRAARANPSLAPPLPRRGEGREGVSAYPINSATLRPNLGRSRAMSRARNATQPAVGERSSVAM